MTTSSEPELPQLPQGNSAPQVKLEPLPDNAQHILVVDDDQRICQLLSRYLMEHGFRVTQANDAESARGHMRGLAFDLIILDVMMPGEDGLSLARSLKLISDIPICMLTARAEHRLRRVQRSDPSK